jgi:cellulose synthase/poly-beta-1,6-N-acetylglucosamine synthase-like glycosyltransferase
MIDLIIGLLTILPQCFVILQQSIYYVYSKRANKVPNNVELHTVSIIIPVKGEKTETIKELLNDIEASNYPKNKIEVIIVSDDNEGDFEKIKESLGNYSFELKLLRRENKVGFKSAALQYGFERSKGELILTLDADSRFNENYIKSMVLHCMYYKSPVVSRWRGKNDETFLGMGMFVTTEIGSKAYLLGRGNLSLLLMPVGSGTIFQRKQLEEVSGWDLEVIQDDLTIGAKLMKKGISAKPNSEVLLLQEVPLTHRALFIQQTRWAYGSAETMRRYLMDIITSPFPIIKKLELLTYLNGYLGLTFNFIGSLLIAILEPYLHSPISYPLLLLWILSFSPYSYIFVKEALKKGYKFIDSIQLMGRISGIMNSFSPFITLSIIRAFTGRRFSYVVTPKGNRGGSMLSVSLISLFLGIITVTSSLLYIFKSIPTSIWLFMVGFGYLYSSYRLSTNQ